jgi:DUF4097 and DUF4098 domain-containing protein YvlB
MWNPKHGRLALAVLVLCLPSALHAGEKIDETFASEPGQRLRLNFNDLSGDVVVEGWDRNSVQVQGETHGRDWEEGAPLDFDQSSRGLSIQPRGRYRHHDRVRLDLHLRVPRETDLQIEAATSLTIRNVSGRLDVSVGNARLDLNDVEGEGRVSSANGRMSLRGCHLDADISNVNGRLRIDSSEILGNISIVNSGLELSNAPEGIELESTNGNIELEHAGRFVQVSTTNGNVAIDELDGWIDAETTNGNVRVRFVGPPEGRRSVDIETLNGNVELEIPDNYSLDFDVRVQSRGDRTHYDIDSDFPLEIEDDSSRREVSLRGTGRLNDGQHRVRIRATNGDVILKRLAAAH